MFSREFKMACLGTFSTPSLGVMMTPSHFAATAGALYLMAGIGVPAVIAMLAIGNVAEGIRYVPAHLDATYIFSVGATLIMIVASFIIGGVLLIRRRVGAIVLAAGVVMAVVGATSGVVRVPVWLLPVPFLWLAYRARNDDRVARPSDGTNGEIAAARPLPDPATGISRIRRWLYVACVATIGGGAILHLLRNDLFQLPYLPVISRFEDPIATVVDFSRLKPLVAQFAFAGIVGRTLSFVVSLLIAALTIRRLGAMRDARTLAVPDTFAGFAYGLMWAALALVPAWFVTQYTLFRSSDSLIIVCVFLAFLLTELQDFRNSRRHRGAQLDGQTAVSHTVMPCRRPIWSILSIVLPLLGAGCMILLATTLGGNSFGPIALGLIAVAIACALGLIADVIAILRSERWIPVQVIGFLVNFGTVSYLGLPVLSDVFRFG